MSGGEGKKSKAEGSREEWDAHVDSLLSGVTIRSNRICEREEDSEGEDWLSARKGSITSYRSASLRASNNLHPLQCALLYTQYAMPRYFSS